MYDLSTSGKWLEGGEGVMEGVWINWSQRVLYMEVLRLPAVMCYLVISTVGAQQGAFSGFQLWYNLVLSSDISGSVLLGVIHRYLHSLQ